MAFPNPQPHAGSCSSDARGRHSDDGISSDQYRVVKMTEGWKLANKPPRPGSTGVQGMVTLLIALGFLILIAILGPG